MFHASPSWQLFVRSFHASTNPVILVHSTQRSCNETALSLVPTSVRRKVLFCPDSGAHSWGRRPHSHMSAQHSSPSTQAVPKRRSPCLDGICCSLGGFQKDSCADLTSQAADSTAQMPCRIVSFQQPRQWSLRSKFYLTLSVYLHILFKILSESGWYLWPHWEISLIQRHWTIEIHQSPFETHSNPVESMTIHQTSLIVMEYSIIYFPAHWDLGAASVQMMRLRSIA